MKAQPYKIVFLLLIIMIGQVRADEVLLLAQVSLDDAVKQVVNGNRLLDAETQSIGDRQVHVIKVLTDDGRVQKHKIDAETGKRMGKGKN